MDEDSFLEEDGESEGELMEEEGEEEEIEIPKFLQLGFENEHQFSVVKEEFLFFDESLSGEIDRSDVEKLLRVLLSTKNKVFTAPMPVVEEIEEVKIEVKVVEEEGEEEEDEVIPEPEPEPEEDIVEVEVVEEDGKVTLDEFCMLLNQIKKFKKIDKAEKKLTDALRFFDKENRRVVNLRQCLKNESFEDILLPETEVYVSNFLEKAKNFEFITHEIHIPENEEKETEDDVEKKRFEIEEYLDDIEEVIGDEKGRDSDEEEEGEDEISNETELFERRKAKLYQTLFYLEYVFLPKKATQECLRIKIENSLLTRVTRLSSKVKALDEEKQQLILDFVTDFDFLNEDRFVGVKNDVTLEDNHFIFRFGDRSVEMMILKDYKLFYKLDQFVCSLF